MGKQQAKPVLLVTPSIKQEASHMIYAMATHNIQVSWGWTRVLLSSPECG
jgi:hypothetical protein